MFPTNYTCAIFLPAGNAEDDACLPHCSTDGIGVCNLKPLADIGGFQQFEDGFSLEAGGVNQQELSDGGEQVVVCRNGFICNGIRKTVGRIAENSMNIGCILVNITYHDEDVSGREGFSTFIHQAYQVIIQHLYFPEGCVAAVDDERAVLYV